MKRIEMLADVKGADGTFRKGEIRLVEPETAGLFCAHGWAKDLGGEVPTGTPDTSPKTLAIDHSTIGQAAQSPGVR